MCLRSGARVCVCVPGASPRPRSPLQPLPPCPACQLERLAGYLVKERQTRDAERAEQRARVEQLERTLASLVARLDGLNGGRTNATGAAEPEPEPEPRQPRPRGVEGADEPRSETPDQAASGSGDGGSERTHVEVDAVGGTRWSAPMSYREWR